MLICRHLNHISMCKEGLSLKVFFCQQCWYFALFKVKGEKNIGYIVFPKMYYLSSKNHAEEKKFVEKYFWKKFVKRTLGSKTCKIYHFLNFPLMPRQRNAYSLHPISICKMSGSEEVSSLANWLKRISFLLTLPSSKM